MQAFHNDKILLHSKSISQLEVTLDLIMPHKEDPAAVCEKKETPLVLSDFSDEYQLSSRG